MKWSVFLVLLSFLLNAQSVLAQGCSQCKMLAEQGSGLDENSFTRNINGGILYLMLMPYLILLFIFRKQIWKFVRGILKPEAR